LKLLLQLSLYLLCVSCFEACASGKSTAIKDSKSLNVHPYESNSNPRNEFNETPDEWMWRPMSPTWHPSSGLISDCEEHHDAQSCAQLAAGYAKDENISATRSYLTLACKNGYDPACCKVNVDKNHQLG
jgi:hypothetical protein